MRNLFLFILLFSLVSCSRKEKEKIVDYSNLDTISIELTAETGEGLLLGSLGSFVMNSKEIFLVSTRQKMTIEQFKADGTYMGRVAHKGRGPGELSDNNPTMFMANDTLVVQQTPSRILSFYAKNSDSLYTFIKSIIPASNQKPIDVIAYAGDQKLWGTVVKYFKPKSKFNPRYWKNVLVLVNRKQKIIQDSVNLLKVPNPGAFFANNGMPLGLLGFPQSDVFRVLQDGLYVIARSKYGTLLFFNNQKKKVNSVVLNVKPRSVTQKDITVLLKDLPSAWQKSVKKHMSVHKPAFVNMWVTNNYIWLDTGQVNKKEQYVVFTRKGRVIGKFFLPLKEDIEEIRNEKVYTIYHSQKGNLIHIYKIDL